MIVRRVQLPGHVQVIAPAGSEMVVTVAGEGTYSIKVGADTVTVAHAAELVFPTTKLDGILWNGPTKTRTEIDAILSESTRNAGHTFNTLCLHGNHAFCAQDDKKETK